MGWVNWPGPLPEPPTAPTKAYTLADGATAECDDPPPQPDRTKEDWGNKRAIQARNAKRLLRKARGTSMNGLREVCLASRLSTERVPAYCVFPAMPRALLLTPAFRR